MTPLPTIDGTWRCAFNWDTNNYTNVIHVHAGSVTPAAVGAAIAGAVSANMWSPMANFRVCTSIDITPLFDLGATFHYTTDGTAKWKGKASVGDEIPNNCAVVSLHTAFRGRSNRGRIYVGPLMESQVAFGLVQGGAISDMVTGWTAFGSALIADDMEHVVASYKNSTALTVETYSVRSAAGTQRRRQSRLA